MTDARPDGWHYLSCQRFTVAIEVRGGRIVTTPPIARRHRGKAPKGLIARMRRAGGFRSVPLALTALLALAACSVPPKDPLATPPPKPEPSAKAKRCPDDTACVRATIDTNAAAIDVELSLPIAALPAGYKKLELPFASVPFKKAPGGYADFVKHKDGGPWTGAVKTAPADGRLTLRYRVDLTHHEAEPHHGIDEVPHPTSRGWFLVGRAFIPYPKVDGVLTDLPAQLTLVVPEGMDLAASVDGEGLVRRGSMKGLADAFYALGAFEARTVRVGESTIALVTSDYTAADLDVLADLVERTLEAGQRHLGPLPTARRLFVYDRQAKGFAGGVVGDDVCVLSTTPPSALGLSAVGGIIVHELLHLWSRADVVWISEGFTRYFELLIGLELDATSETEAIAHLLLLMGEYEANRQKKTPIAAATGLWAYPAGALVAFCLDATLRAQGHDLYSVYRDAMAKTNAAGVTEADLRATLEATAPALVDELDAWVSAETPLDLNACLNRAGYTSSQTTYTGYTLRALVLDVLQITSFSPQRPEVFDAKPGSVFQGGDLITSVSGRSVRTIPEIDHLLRDAKAGASVPVTVVRDRKTVELELKVPKVSSKSREARSKLKIEIAQKKSRTSPLIQRPRR